MAKQYALGSHEIDQLIDDTRMCLATDRIVVDAEPVGIMYREEPAEDDDSGWRFMAGDETAEYMADRANIGVYRLNTLANYDRCIVEHLDASPGAEFSRQGDTLVATPASSDGGANGRGADDSGDDDDGGAHDGGAHDGGAHDGGDDGGAHDGGHPELHPGFPVVEGIYQMTPHWAVTVPDPCNRRFEDGTMVLWRPGWTVHVMAWDNTTGATLDEREDEIAAAMSPDATDLERRDEGDFVRLRYRLVEQGQASINAFVVAAPAQLLASIYFDDAAGERAAVEIADSLRLSLVETD